MLLFESGEPFSSGATQYKYEPATEWDSTARIMLPVVIGGIQTLAMVDTGAPYVVCTPEIADALNLDHGVSLGSVRIRWRGSLLGRLYRESITFLGEEGDSLRIDATMFVPDADYVESWTYRRRAFVIGMGGCLERLRFAIDPNDDMFYFGV